MTTLSVVDVESIVGDMPAQACEFPDEKCDAQASWIARAHISDHLKHTCCVTALTLCDGHMNIATITITTLMEPVCPWCGVNVTSVFYRERL